METPILARLLPVLLLVTLGATGAAAMGVRSEPGGAGGAPAETDIVPGEVLVQFRDDVRPDARDALLSRLGLRVKASLGGQNAYVVSILDGSSVAAAIARLRAEPEVVSAEPNRIIRLQPPIFPQPPPARS